jgi:hypothetical protein
LVNARFGPPLMDMPLGELAMLGRLRSVDEFAKRFMAFSCRDPSITEPQQIQLFITGLDDPLRSDIALQQPSLMDDAVIFARAYEQRLALHETGPQSTVGGVGRTGARNVPQQGASSTSASIGTAPATLAKPPPTVVCLSPAEIVQRCKDNKCFHCDEFFTNGHKQQCKQLFVIEVLDAEEEHANHGPVDTKPTISILALTGIQPRKGCTLQVFVTIYDAVLRALLDSGSTHNFVDSKAAAHVGLSSAAMPGSAL